MRIFISWSGARSKAVAELLDEWIQCVLQTAIPWMSSKDIDRGSLWFSEVNDALKDTSIGIVCLTQDNKNKPWILFESGALAKGITSARVCTILVDLQPADVSNPLAQFNHTFPDKDGIWQLVITLNNALNENALKEKVLERVFETYWPQFEDGFQRALSENHPSEVIEPRSDENMLAEVLTTVRSTQQRLRKLESGSGHLSQRGSVVVSKIRFDRPDKAKSIAETLAAQGENVKSIETFLEEHGVPETHSYDIARSAHNSMSADILVENED